ncbi:MAG: hypothetical protein Q8P49_00805 [Candidatus Liptonbacteria bacterium]|nr:hypothetical protein [Candidatus Liptonbacteria bacterium]
MSDKERQRHRVLEYIEKHATDQNLARPLSALSKMLLENFGLPTAAGRKRAAEILEEPGVAKRLQCQRDGNNSLRSIRLIKEEIAEAIGPTSARPAVTIPRKQCRRGHQKLGVDERRKRKAVEIGDRNESRCCQITHRIVTMLRTLFPDQIVEASYVRSGRHDPKRGKIDMADHNGEDIGIWISAKLLDGTMLSGRIVIDAKSSAERTEKFNRTIRMGRYAKETGVLAKRAILVNHLRPESHVAEDILSAIISGGFHFIAAEQETIVAAFQSC